MATQAHLATQQLMENFRFNAALKAASVESALFHLKLNTLTIDELEDLAWCFAFNNGNSKIAPSERESALATACLEQIDKLEAKDIKD